MTRTLSLATALAAVIALPVMAEDAQTGIEPGAGATSTTSEQMPMPQMKSEAAGEVRPNTSANETKPGGQMPASAEQQSTGISLTEREALTWIDKPVYSSDGKQIGKVAAFQRGPDNKVIGMRADIGGFLGFGESRVNITPEQFKLQSDRVVLSLTTAEANDLPKVQK
jgi:PRC-barrel domain